jgi:CRP-like cAMP-binding protein
MSGAGEKRGMFIFGAGTLLNEDCVNGGKISVSAEALRDSEILRIERGVVKAACARDADLSAALLDSLSLKVRRLYHLM